MRGRSGGVLLHGIRYCGAECLQRALVEALDKSRPARQRELVASHRIPLGLILLSRQQLTAEQLRTALGAQRDAGCGRIGEWLQQLGFASELNITGALARQWSCPVLRNEAALGATDCCALIPLSLLEFFQMMPVAFAAASGTLLVGFSDRIDYTALYAVERILGYHTEPCLMSANILHERVRALARQRTGGDVFFDRVEDDAECARIVGSYAARISAKELRMARCGKYLWVRLKPATQNAINLVLTCRQGALSSLFSSSAGLSGV
jgi:Type II secretion system (T2SS), protein E, N-terminal domain